MAMFSAWLGWGHFGSGKIRLGREYILKAKEFAEGGRPKSARVCPHLFLLGRGLHGHVRRRPGFSQKGARIGKAFPSDHYISFKALAGIGFVHSGMGDLRSARVDGQALLDYGREHSNHRSLVLGYFAMAQVHFSKGDMASAIEWLHKSIDAARDPFYSQVARPFLGAALLVTGRLDEADEELTAAIAFSERGGGGWFGAWAYLFRAMARIARGQVGDGLKDLEALRDSSLENGNMAVCVIAEQLLGSVYLRMVEGGGPVNFTALVKNLPFLVTTVPFADSKAQKHLGEAVRLSKEIGGKLDLGQAYLSLGLLHRAKKRREKAKECLSEAVQLLTECDADGPLREAAEALESLGEPARVHGKF